MLKDKTSDVERVRVCVCVCVCVMFKRRTLLLHSKNY